MKSLQMQEVHDSQSSTGLFSSTSPYKIQGDASKSSFQSSPKDNSEVKTEEQLGSNDIQIVDDGDDTSSNQEPLRLPFVFDDEAEFIDANQYSSDHYYETEDIQQYQDQKESNPLYSVVSIQGNRKDMQDKYSTFINFNNLNFYGVFDGHGNEKIACYLRDNLFQSLTSHPSFFTNVEEAITQTLDQFFQTSEEFSGSGCVCVCALIVNGNLYVINLGDCRAVLFDSCGKQRDLSFDHTPSNRKDEMERIKNQNGFCLRSGSQLRVSGELNVTRAFGDKRYKPFIIAQPEIIVYDIYSLLSEFEFREVFLVLASDGLWNDYNQKAAPLLCNQGYESFPEKALEYIYDLKECFRDNTTIMSINLQSYYLSLLNSYNMSETVQTD